MKTRPTTPPQSVANCWMSWATEASGGEVAVTRWLSAAHGDRCSRRKADLDAQAAELRILEAQLAVVQRDLLGDDRQTEPGAGRGRRRPARERLEQALALGSRDARPVVVDAHEEVVLRARERDPHVAAGAAVERGVVEEVVDEEPEAAVPAVDGGVVDLVVELVRDARVAAAGGEQRRVDQVAELDLLARE